MEENIKSELQRAQAAAASESVKSNDYLIKNNGEDQEDEEFANSVLLKKLEEKKKELVCSLAYLTLHHNSQCKLLFVLFICFC